MFQNSSQRTDDRESQGLMSYARPLFALLRFLIPGVLILSAIYGLNQLQLSQYFPISTVRVYGVNHTDKTEVQAVLSPMVTRGFFNINVEYIRDRLMQMPWVSDIYVRRNWPDQVEVTVIEKTPVARWNQEALLSDAGELFTPSEESFTELLPKFIGPAGKQIMMLDLYHQINRLLQPLHAKISYLELTPYYTWKVILNNGIALQIGHKDVLTRLDHFVKVYPKIVGDRSADVEYVDLRYPNGVAIQWKAPVKA